MRFEKKTFNITDAPKKEVWIGERDSTGKYNSIALVDVRDEKNPSRIYYGEVSGDYFNGLGVMCFSDSIKKKRENDYFTPIIRCFIYYFHHSFCF